MNCSIANKNLLLPLEFALNYELFFPLYVSKAKNLFLSNFLFAVFRFLFSLITFYIILQLNLLVSSTTFFLRVLHNFETPTFAIILSLIYFIFLLFSISFYILLFSILLLIFSNEFIFFQFNNIFC